MNMKMKFLLAPALTLIASSGLWGQATKVALINMQQAIANTKEGQTQLAELDKKYGPKQQEFQKRAADIQTKQDQLKKTQNTISDDAKAALDAEINRLKTSLQRDTTDAQTDSEEDEQKLMGDIGPKLVSVVTKYAQDNQIMLVSMSAVSRITWFAVAAHSISRRKSSRSTTRRMSQAERQRRPRSQPAPVPRRQRDRQRLPPRPPDRRQHRPNSGSHPERFRIAGAKQMLRPFLLPVRSQSRSRYCSIASRTRRERVRTFVFAKSC